MEPSPQFEIEMSFSSGAFDIADVDDLASIIGDHGFGSDRQHGFTTIVSDGADGADGASTVLQFHSTNVHAFLSKCRPWLNVAGLLESMQLKWRERNPLCPGDWRILDPNAPEID